MYVHIQIYKYIKIYTRKKFPHTGTIEKRQFEIHRRINNHIIVRTRPSNGKANLIDQECLVLRTTLMQPARGKAPRDVDEPPSTGIRCPQDTPSPLRSANDTLVSTDCSKRFASDNLLLVYEIVQVPGRTTVVLGRCGRPKRAGTYRGYLTYSKNSNFSSDRAAFVYRPRVSAVRTNGTQRFRMTLPDDAPATGSQP